MIECIWFFQILVASLRSSIGAAFHGYMFRLTDPEEPPTKDFNLDYTEDLGYDLPSATPHQTS
jgi:hypothetical protein